MALWIHKIEFAPFKSFLGKFSRARETPVHCSSCKRSCRSLSSGACESILYSSLGFWPYLTINSTESFSFLKQSYRTISSVSKFVRLRTQTKKLESCHSAIEDVAILSNISFLKGTSER